jgi:hypothetical protein
MPFHRVLAATAVVALIAWSSWLYLRPAGVAEPAPQLLPPPAPLEVMAASAPPSKARIAPETTAPASAEPHDALRPSHPITPAHQRIFRENNLIGRLNAAMDLGDFQELRRRNAEYRQQYPEDSHRLQEPYDLIAACQESPSDATRQAAQRYWSDHRGSTLRRYIRRYCLEDGV